MSVVLSVCVQRHAKIDLDLRLFHSGGDPH